MPERPISVDLYEGWTDVDLVYTVNRNAGTEGAGAHAELLRRATIASNEQAKKADDRGRQLADLTKWLIGLTVALIALAGVQLYVAIR